MNLTIFLLNRDTYIRPLRISKKVWILLLNCILILFLMI